MIIMVDPSPLRSLYSDDATIQVWETKTRRTVLGRLRGHTNTVWLAVYPLDDRRIASNSKNNTIRIWDVRAGEIVLGPPIEHDIEFKTTTYVPDGESIISASSD